jgi:3',5'-cyclic AMP phosphodiesterase CpdA
MPIYVPALSRRRFLTGSLAAGAGVMLGGPLLADTTPVDANRYVLLSDLHVWEHRKGEHGGQFPTPNFEAARSEILALTPRPATAIVSGDCVFREGHAEDYAVLADLIHPLRKAGISFHFALGNHDGRENFHAAFPETKPKSEPPVPHKCVAIQETPHANWFLLDSLLKTNHTPGRLGKVQLEWLAKALDARSDKPALVVAHHNLDTKPNTHGLEDTQALLDVISTRKQVKAYIYGHRHRWSSETQDGLHMVNVPTLVWVFDQKQPRGWVDVRLRPDGAALVLHALDKAHKANGQTIDLKWRS